MINLMNLKYEKFITQIGDKKLYLWGAGKRAVKMCELLKNIEIVSIIDNDREKCGDKLECSYEKIPIISLNQFINRVKENRDIVLLITTAFYVQDIIEQLNKERELDNLECYVLNYLIDTFNVPKFSFTEGKEKIPKKIHYCWFGEKEIPNKLVKCIDSWKKYCPDYEIIRWDENNYDVEKNNYMKQAYQNKKWGFVPDYARLDILYTEGGIYLDTDVELLKSLDDFLKDEMFCAFINAITIGIGAGIGAVKGNILIKQLRDNYENISFSNGDGRLNMTPANWYTEEILKNNGFEIVNRYQKKDGMVIYPAGVFISRDLSYKNQIITSKTVGVHHGSGSWHDDNMKIALNK